MKDRIAIILHSILYVLNKFDNKTVDSHKLSKILYFADQKHLTKYGKDITGDSYVAMKFGPVPSCVLDIINCAKDGSTYEESIELASNGIDVDGYNVKALSDFDPEWLSKSEINCIDESFEENKNLSFSQLTDKSHDMAWNVAMHYMDKKKIAEAGGANEALLNYIDSKEEVKNISF